MSVDWWMGLAHAKMKWSNYTSSRVIFGKQFHFSRYSMQNCRCSTYVLNQPFRIQHSASACAFTFICFEEKKKYRFVSIRNMMKFESLCSHHFEHKISFVVRLLFAVCFPYWSVFYRSEWKIYGFIQFIKQQRNRIHKCCCIWKMNENNNEMWKNKMQKRSRMHNNYS